MYNSDCRQVLAGMEANFIDSVVTDPPYGLKFLGKEWDHGVPGVPFWQEILRVAKPGAFLLAFGGTRTFHRLACVIEDAGWEIRDCIMWVYSSGFPKSLDIGKALDKAAGATRTEVIGQYKPPQMDKPWNLTKATDERSVEMFSSSRNNLDILAPVTDEAKEWNGWGTALKPAWEPIIVARKPLEGTTVQNVLIHGTGGINIDDSRVATTSGIGRWPSNFIHDGSNEVVELLPTKDMSRFFYCAKASKKERNFGLPENVTNNHPTVKPPKLMEYLVKLVTPRNGTVLDPFMGSGSTGLAAAQANFNFVGIDNDEEYFQIATTRVTSAYSKEENTNEDHSITQSSL